MKEVCHEKNLDTKSDLSLGDLKMQKTEKSLLKKSSQIEFDFFYSELPNETRTSLFIAFSVLGTKNWSFF